MPEPLRWSKFVHPMPRQRERMVEVHTTCLTVDSELHIFFDPVSHYLFKEITGHARDGSGWFVADLPCNKGKPRP